MAQWKRAGPITQRSEDQNLALLKMPKGHLLPIFATNQIKETQALGNAIEIGNSVRVVKSWDQESSCGAIGVQNLKK